jgi:hypothetical protein
MSEEVFKFSADVGLHEWKRSANYWTLTLPYLTLGMVTRYSVQYGYSVKYGYSRALEVTLVSGRCTSIFTVEIPDDAIWSLADFDDSNPRRTGIFVHDSIFDVRLLHVLSERHDELVDILRVAVDDDDLCGVQSCMEELRKIRAPFRRGASGDCDGFDDLLIDARSGEVALALANSRKVVVKCMCAFWRVSPSQSPAPGKTRIQRDDGVTVHVWDSLVAKYRLCTSDLVGSYARYPCRNSVCSSLWIQQQIQRRRTDVADEIRRTRDRLDAYKRQLMERTWHPSRLAWCLDTEEIEEIELI